MIYQDIDDYLGIEMYCRRYRYQEKIHLNQDRSLLKLKNIYSDNVDININNIRIIKLDNVKYS